MDNDLEETLEGEDQEKREPGWAPSRALIAVSSKSHDGDNATRSCLLYYEGSSLSSEIENSGLDNPDDLGLQCDAPQGISVWEGEYNYDSWGDTKCEGKFRRPTPEEWSFIRAGLSPWAPLECAPNHDVVRRLERPAMIAEPCGHPLEFRPETLAALQASIVKGREGYQRDGDRFALGKAHAALSAMSTQSNDANDCLYFARLALEAYELLKKK